MKRLLTLWIAAMCLVPASCHDGECSSSDCDRSCREAGSEGGECSGGACRCLEPADGDADSDIDGDGDDDTDDDTIDDGDVPVEVTLEAVRAAVASDCSEASLAPIRGADPEDVLELLAEVDAELKATEWTEGLTDGHPLPEVELRTAALEGFAFDYSLHVPGAYHAVPDRPFALYLDPGHPTDPVSGDRTLPHLAIILDEYIFFVRDNYFNRLYTELGDEAYEAQVLHNPDFNAAAAYQDHQEIIRVILRQLRQRFWIDSDRIYVGGVSAKGNAAWGHGIQSSDQFAAIMPVSAGTAPYHDDLWQNLLDTPILAVHGTEDPLCPVGDVDDLVSRLEGWGCQVEYWREEGETHGSMFLSQFPEMVDWLLDHQRDLQPARVHEAIMSERDPGTFWLRLVEPRAPLDPELPMQGRQPPVLLDATWSEEGLEVVTRGVASFEVWFMEGRPGPASGRPGETIRVVVDSLDLGELPLETDATLALRDYCRHADLRRAWIGRVAIDLP